MESKEFIKKTIINLKEKHKDSLFAIHSSDKELNLYYYKKGKDVVSLRDGNYTQYKSHSDSSYRCMNYDLKVKDGKYSNRFFTINEVIDRFSEEIDRVLKSVVVST